jgi:hypothetical protein
MDPGQVQNGSNLAGEVIVRHCLIKAERIKQLTLVPIKLPIIDCPRRQSQYGDGITVRGNHQRLLQQNLPLPEMGGYPPPHTRALAVSSRVAAPSGMCRGSIRKMGSFGAIGRHYILNSARRLSVPIFTCHRFARRFRSAREHRKTERVPSNPANGIVGANLIVSLQYRQGGAPER